VFCQFSQVFFSWRVFGAALNFFQIIFRRYSRRLEVPWTRGCAEYATALTPAHNLSLSRELEYRLLNSSPNRSELRKTHLRAPLCPKARTPAPSLGALHFAACALSYQRRSTYARAGVGQFPFNLLRHLDILPQPTHLFDLLAEFHSGRNGIKSMKHSSSRTSFAGGHKADRQCAANLPDGMKMAIILLLRVNLNNKDSVELGKVSNTQRRISLGGRRRTQFIFRD